MILALDIGNSRIKAGIRKGTDIECYITDTRPFQNYETYIERLNLREPVEGVVLSTVVEELEETFQKVAQALAKKQALVVDHTTYTGLKYSVQNAENLGADRIANAVGAYHAAGGPVIVIDLGSAITLSVIGKDADFLGGAIMPGVIMMAESLKEKTSKLPAVDFRIPDAALGKDTISNIQTGLSYGSAGAIERVVYEIRREIGYTMKVILTGGMCSIFQKLIRGIDIVDPTLTLKGLFSIYELNSNNL